MSVAMAVHRWISFLHLPHPWAWVVWLKRVSSLDFVICRIGLLDAMLIALSTLCQLDKTAATATITGQLILTLTHDSGRLAKYLPCRPIESSAYQQAFASDLQVPRSRLGGL